MPDTLPALEAPRAAMPQQIALLGDMRAGSITTTGGRCGKSRCHCHEKDALGHGPLYRLTRKVDGKTITETFSTPAALHKTQKRNRGYHRFRELSRDLLQVNERICRARPAQDTLTPEEKKRPRRFRTRSREVATLLGRILAGRKQTARTDLEALETALRAALHRAGGAALDQVIALPRARRRGAHNSVLLRSTGALPRTSLAAVHALVGQQVFDHGREQMKGLAGLEVTTKAVDPIAEAIGQDIAHP